MSKGFIFISKVDMSLTLVDCKGDTVVSYPIACGRNIGPKSQKGDFKTPEGYFSLQMIHDSSLWGHDFHDGNGYIRNAYGPYFMRLKTGFNGIGIHGTHAPESIGTRATEGCIRLENNNVAELQRLVVLGMPVIIGPEYGLEPDSSSIIERPFSAMASSISDLQSAAKAAQVIIPSPLNQLANVVLASKPKIIDGSLDIDPEEDLVEVEEQVVPERVEVVEAEIEPTEIEQVEINTAETETLEIETVVLEETPALEPLISSNQTAPGRRARTPHFVSSEAEVFTEIAKPDIKEEAVEVAEAVETEVENESSETTNIVESLSDASDESIAVSPITSTEIEEETIQESEIEVSATIEETMAAEPEDLTDTVESIVAESEDSRASSEFQQELEYEVVVEEVVGPDGQVQFEVQYKRKEQ